MAEIDMTRRRKQLLFIIGGLAGLGIATGLVLNSFRSNLLFFYTPTQVMQHEVPNGEYFRIGGLVQDGSLQRAADGMTVRFVITDTARQVAVTYHGILPDLFAQGKGVVAQGRVAADGVFHADRVLAKHDANYMPPEAAQALKQAQANQSGQALQTTTRSGS